MTEKSYFSIVEKTDLLAPKRHALVLLKEGCPVGCSEWMPVSKEFYDSVIVGDRVVINIKRLCS
jgi:hypothetical protein